MFKKDLVKKAILITIALGLILFFLLKYWSQYRLERKITTSKYNEENDCYEEDSILPVINDAKCCKDLKFIQYKGGQDGISGYCIR